MEANPMTDIVVDVGPMTLADAIAAREALRGAHGCEAVAAMFALRVAQAEHAAVLELRDELDDLLPPAVPVDAYRPEAFPRGVPFGRWL